MLDVKPYFTYFLLTLSYLVLVTCSVFNISGDIHATAESAKHRKNPDSSREPTSRHAVEVGDEEDTEEILKRTQPVPRDEGAKAKEIFEKLKTNWALLQEYNKHQASKYRSSLVTIQEMNFKFPTIMEAFDKKDRLPEIVHMPNKAGDEYEFTGQKLILALESDEQLNNLIELAKRHKEYKQQKKDRRVHFNPKHTLHIYPAGPYIDIIKNPDKEQTKLKKEVKPTVRSSSRTGGILLSVLVIAGGTLLLVMGEETKQEKQGDDSTNKAMNSTPSCRGRSKLLDAK